MVDVLHTVIQTILYVQSSKVRNLYHARGGMYHDRVASKVNVTYHNVDQAIKKLIIKSFDNAYRNALSDEIVGYATCMSLQLLTHLLKYYAMIAPTELTQNYERLNKPYDPNQTIDMLFQQIQEAGAFALTGGQPYGAAMILKVEYTLVSDT
jgi:hypothetical protein